MAPPQFWGPRFWSFLLLLADRADRWSTIAVPTTLNEFSDIKEFALDVAVMPSTVSQPPLPLVLTSHTKLTLLRGFAFRMPCGDCTEHFMMLLKAACLTVEQQRALKQNRWPSQGLFEWLVGVRGIVADKAKRPRRSTSECRPVLNREWYQTMWWVLYMMAMGCPVQLPAFHAETLREFMSVLGLLVPHLNRAMWDQILQSLPGWNTSRDGFYEAIHRLQTQPNLFGGLAMLPVEPAFPKEIRVKQLKELADWITEQRRLAALNSLPTNPNAVVALPFQSTANPVGETASATNSNPIALTNASPTDPNPVQAEPIAASSTTSEEKTNDKPGPEPTAKMKLDQFFDSLGWKPDAEVDSKHETNGTKHIDETDVQVSGSLSGPSSGPSSGPISGPLNELPVAELNALGPVNTTGSVNATTVSPQVVSSSEEFSPDYYILAMATGLTLIAFSVIFVGMLIYLTRGRSLARRGPITKSLPSAPSRISTPGSVGGPVPQNASG